MATRKSAFINMIAALFFVTFLSAASLGFIYNMTKDAIELSKLKIQSEAIEKILPEFDRLADTYKLTADSQEDTLEIFPAYKDDKLIGVAIKTFSKRGFSGYISIMAGIDTSGNFSGYEVLEHTETPGLGSKMDNWFSNTEKTGQCIIGKNPESSLFKVEKDGGDINAITAATITSRAFLDAMNRAYRAYDKYNQNTKSGSAGK